MTVLSNAQEPRGSGMESLRARCGWIIALGFVYIAAGLMALSSVVLATVASVFFVGVMMMIAGVAEVISAFQLKSWGKFLLWIVLGVLYVVAGLVTFENPLLAAAVFTLMLGATLVGSGAMRIMLAFSMKEGTPWMGAALSGVITILLGGVILAHWPVSSLYIIGIFLGIDLVFVGTRLDIGWFRLEAPLTRERALSTLVGGRFCARSRLASTYDHRGSRRARVFGPSSSSP